MHEDGSNHPATQSQATAHHFNLEENGLSKVQSPLAMSHVRENSAEKSYNLQENKKRNVGSERLKVTGTASCGSYGGYIGRKEDEAYGTETTHGGINPTTASGDVSNTNSFAEKVIGCRTPRERALALEMPGGGTPRRTLRGAETSRDTPRRTHRGETPRVIPTCAETPRGTQRRTPRGTLRRETHRVTSTGTPRGKQRVSKSPPKTAQKPNSSIQTSESVLEKPDPSQACSGQKSAADNPQFQQSDNSSRPSWNEEVVPVPDDLLTVTQAENILKLQNKGTNKYLDELRQMRPPSEVYQNGSSESTHIRPRYSLLPSVPSSLKILFTAIAGVQVAYEDWLRKHQHVSPSVSKASLSTQFSSKRRRGRSANVVKEDVPFEPPDTIKYSLQNLKS
eukprot:Gb_29330 [translate_table: standard]